MRRSLGFAVFESISIVAVVAVLAAFLMVSARKDLESAERMEMEAQARAIGNALQFRMARTIVQRDDDEIARITRGNPVRWLSAPPANYIGELTQAPKKDAALGAWYYDPAAEELVYHVRRGDYFLPDTSGRRRVRFRVEVVREGDRDDGSVVGAVFRPVEPYRWR